MDIKLIKKVINVLGEKFQIFFNKTVALVVLYGLIIPYLSGVFLFAVDQLDLDSYKRDMMDVYFKIADNVNDEEQWREIIESRLDVLKADWEEESLDKIDKKIKKDVESGSTESEAELRVEYLQAYDIAKEEWEEDAESDIHKEQGRWIFRRIDMEWQNIDRTELMSTIEEANKNYLYEMVDGEYVYNEYGYRVIRSIETLDYAGEFLQWDDMVSSVIDNDVNKYISMLESDMMDVVSKISSSSGITIDNVMLNAYIEEEKAIRIEAFRKEREYIYTRERSRMKYQRLYDERSLRKDSEDKSPEVIADKLIVETEREIDKEMEEFRTILEAQKPDGTEEDIERFDNIKMQIESIFESGMNKWEDAKKDFLSQRIMWEDDIANAIKNGEKLWADAFKKFDEARSRWEVNLDEIIAEGISEWDRKEDELWENVANAKEDLNKYLESLRQEWDASGEGLVGTINSGIQMLKQANENIEFFKRSIKNCSTAGKSELIPIYREALLKWQNYRDEFAVMVYNANEEYNELIKNNMEGENNFISKEITVYDFNNKIILGLDKSILTYYKINDAPGKVEIQDLLDKLDAGKRSSVLDVIEKYYEKASDGSYKIKDGLSLTKDEKFIIAFNLYDIGYTDKINCSIDRNIFPKETTYQTLSGKITGEESKTELEKIEYEKYYVIENMPESIEITGSLGSDALKLAMIEKYYTRIGGNYELIEGVQIPNEKRYLIVSYLKECGIDVNNLLCRLDETVLQSRVEYASYSEKMEYKANAKNLLLDSYEYIDGVYTLKSDVSQAEKLQLLEVFDFLGYSGYRHDNDMLENYKNSGILTDYDVELIKIKGTLDYWTERLKIIEELISYSEDYSSEKDTKEKTTDLYNEAEEKFLEAKTFYEEKLDILRNLAVELEEIKDQMTEQEGTTADARYNMESAKSEYLKVYEALKRSQTGLAASTAPFHEQYVNYLTALRDNLTSKNEYYKMLLERTDIDVVKSHYESVAKMINGDNNDGSIGLEGYRTIKESFKDAGGSPLEVGITFESDGKYDFNELKSRLNPIFDNVFKDLTQLNTYFEAVNTEYDDPVNLNNALATRVSAANNETALKFAKGLRNVYQAINSDKYPAGSVEYKNVVTRKLFELEEILLQLNTAVNEDFNTALINVKQALGDSSYESTVWGDVGTSSALYQRVYALMNPSESEIGQSASVEEVKAKVKELLLKFEYNKAYVNNNKEIIDEFIVRMNEKPLLEEITKVSYGSFYDAIKSEDISKDDITAFCKLYKIIEMPNSIEISGGISTSALLLKYYNFTEPDVYTLKTGITSWGVNDKDKYDLAKLLYDNGYESGSLELTLNLIGTETVDDINKSWKILQVSGNASMYDNISAILSQMNDEFIDLYKEYKAKTAGVTLKDVEKAKALLDLANYHAGGFDNEYYLDLCLIGKKELTDSEKGNLEENSRILLGLLGRVGLEEEDLLMMTEVEKAYYDILFDPEVSKETRLAEIKKLEENNKYILTLLGYDFVEAVPYTAEELGKVEKSLDNLFVLYMDNLDEAAKEERDSLSAIQTFLNASQPDYVLDKYRFYRSLDNYYDELDKLNELIADKAVESVIEAQKKKVMNLYEVTEFCAQNENYRVQFFGLSSYKGNNDQYKLIKAGSLEQIVTGLKNARESSLQKYKTLSEDKTFVSLEDVISDNASIEELRYWIDNYFALDRGTLTPEVENMLGTLYGNYQNLDLIYSLIDSKDEIYKVMNEQDPNLKNAYLQALIADEESLKGSWIEEFDNLTDLMNVYTQRYMNLSMTVNGLMVNEGKILKSGELSDSYNKDDFSSIQIEKIMDKLYLEIKSMEISDGESGLNILMMMDDLLAYYDELLAKAEEQGVYDTEILDRLKERRDNAKELMDSLVTTMNNVKENYLTNLGLNVGMYLLGKLDKVKDTNYFSYLKDNLDKIAEWVNGYKTKYNRSVDWDGLSDEEKDVVIKEINYLIAMRYMQDVSYVFNEEGLDEEDDNIILLSSVDSEVNRIIDNYNLTDNEKTDIEKYIRTEVFKQVEANISDVKNSNVKPVINEYYYTQELMKWLDNEFGEASGRVDYTENALYNDFVIKYLDQPGYVMWSDITTKEVDKPYSMPVEKIKQTTIKGDNWEINSDKELLINGEVVYDLSVVGDFDPTTIGTYKELNAIGIYVDFTENTISINQCEYVNESGKWLLKIDEMTDEAGDVVRAGNGSGHELEIYNVNGNNVLKHSYDFDASSLLTQLYSVVYEYADNKEKTGAANTTIDTLTASMDNISNILAELALLTPDYELYTAGIEERAGVISPDTFENNIMTNPGLDAGDISILTGAYTVSGENYALNTGLTAEEKSAVWAVLNKAGYLESILNSERDALAMEITIEENKLDGYNSEWSENREELEYYYLTSYFERSYGIDVPVEYKEYLNSVVIKKFRDELDGYKEFMNESDFREYSNAYSYLKEKDPEASDAEIKTIIDAGSLSSEEIAVAGDIDHNDVTGYLKKLYQNDISDLTAEIADIESEITVIESDEELSESEKSDKIAEKNEEKENIEQYRADIEKYLARLNENSVKYDGILTQYDAIESAGGLTEKEKENQKGVFGALYLDKSKEEFNYYLKNYMMQAEKNMNFENVFGLFDIEGEQAEKLLTYGKAVNLYYKNFVDEGLISFEEYLNWDELALGDEEKESIINLKNNYFADGKNPFDAEYNIYSKNKYGDVTGGLVNDYITLKGKLAKANGEYTQVLSKQSNDVAVVKKKIDMIRKDDLGDMRGYLDYLTFKTEGSESSIADLTVTNKWIELCSSDPEMLRSDYYLKGLYKNSSAAANVDQVIDIVRDGNLLRIEEISDKHKSQIEYVMEEGRYQDEIYSKLTPDEQTLFDRAYKYDEDNNLYIFNDEINYEDKGNVLNVLENKLKLEKKEYYAPLCLGGNETEKHYGGKILDLFNTFYKEFESTKDVINSIKSKDTTFVDGYLTHLKTNYDYVNGTSTTPGDPTSTELYKSGYDPITNVFKADFTALDGYFNTYGDKYEENVNTQMTKMTKQYQQSQGALVSLEEQMNYTGFTIDMKSKGEVILANKLDARKTILDSATTVYNDENVEFENVKTAFDNKNSEYLDEWDGVREAYDEYMVKKKHLDYRTAIKEYAESSYLKIGSELESPDDAIASDKGTDPLGDSEDEITNTDTLGMSMNLYAIKNRIKEKVDRTEYLYDGMMANYKEYNDRKNGLDNIVVSVREEIAKEDFESKIYDKLSAEDQEKILQYYKLDIDGSYKLIKNTSTLISTGERREISEIFAAAEYKEGEVYTYSDIKENYTEATERYDRLVKTQNDLIEKQKMLKEKEIELRNRQLEIESDMLTDISFEDAVSGTAGSDTLFDHTTFDGNEIDFTNGKVMRYDGSTGYIEFIDKSDKYRFPPIGKYTFTKKILNALSASDKALLAGNVTAGDQWIYENGYYVYDKDSDSYVLRSGLSDAEKNKIEELLNKVRYYKYYYEAKYEAAQREDYVDFIRYVNGKGDDELYEMFMKWGMEWTRDKENSFGGDMHDYYDIDLKMNYRELFEVQDLEDKAGLLTGLSVGTLGFPLSGPMYAMIGGYNGEAMNAALFAQKTMNRSSEEGQRYEWFMQNYYGRDKGQDIGNMMNNATNIEINKVKANTYYVYGATMCVLGGIDVALGLVWSVMSILMGLTALALSVPPVAALAAVFYALAAVFGAIAAGYFAKGGIELGYGIGGINKGANLQKDAGQLEKNNEDMVSKLKDNSEKFVNLEDSLIIVRDELKKIDGYDSKDAMFSSLTADNDTPKEMTKAEMDKITGADKAYIESMYVYDSEKDIYRLKSSLSYEEEAELYIKCKDNGIINDTGINYNPIRRDDDSEEWNDMQYVKEAMGEYEGKIVGDEVQYSSIDALDAAIRKAGADKDRTKNEYYEMVKKLNFEHEAKMNKYKAVSEGYVTVGFKEEEAVKMWEDAYGVTTMENQIDINEVTDELMYSDPNIPRTVTGDVFEEKVMSKISGDDLAFVLNSFNMIDNSKEEEGEEGEEEESSKNRVYILKNDMGKDNTIRLSEILYGIGFTEDRYHIQLKELSYEGETINTEDVDEEMLNSVINDTFGDDGFDFSIMMRDNLDMHKELYADAMKTSLYGKTKMKNFGEYLNQMSENRDPATIVMDQDVNDNTYVYEMLVNDEYPGGSNYVDAKGNVKRSYLDGTIYDLNRREAEIPEIIKEYKKDILSYFNAPDIIWGADIRAGLDEIVSGATDKEAAKDALSGMYTMTTGLSKNVVEDNGDGTKYVHEYRIRNYQQRIVKSRVLTGYVQSYDSNGNYRSVPQYSYTYEYVNRSTETINHYYIDSSGKKKEYDREVYNRNGYTGAYAWYVLNSDTLINSANNEETFRNIADALSDAGYINPYVMNEINDKLESIQFMREELPNIATKKGVLSGVENKVRSMLGGSANSTKEYTEEQWKEFEDSLMEWGLNNTPADTRDVYLEYIKGMITYRQQLTGSDNFCEELRVEYKKVANLAFNRKIEQQVKLQNNEWEHKIKSFLSEKKSWLDKIFAIRDRATYEWRNMLAHLRKKKRLWQEDMESFVTKKNEEWQGKYQNLLDGQKNWTIMARDAVENRTTDDIESLLNVSFEDQKFVTDEDNAWIAGMIGTAESMTGVVEGYYDSPILASIMQNANWSADKIKLADTALTVTEVRRAMTGNANSIVKEFNDKIKSMTKDMQKAANLTAYGNLMQMVADFRESVNKTNKDTDENTFGKMFREKGYRSEGDEWERQVIAGYSLDRASTGCKDIVTQKVKDYDYYDIPSDLLQFDVIKSEKELVNKDPGEAGILVKLEMENIQNDIKKIMPTIKNNNEYKFGGFAYERPDPKSFKYENYRESIYYHIGDGIDGGDYNYEKLRPDGYTGHGEMGRITARLAYYDALSGRYRGKEEGNFFKAVELWDTDYDNDGATGDNGSWSITLSTLYSITTGVLSSVGSIIGAGASTAAGVGVSVGINAAVAGLNIGIQAGVQAADTSASTAGRSNEEKANAWKNYGINMGVSVIGSGLSVAGSAIGGAVSGATSSLGGAVSGCLSSVASTAMTSIGNYGLNMGVNAIRYASGEMSEKEMIQSAISGGISSTISIGASAATGAIGGALGKFGTGGSALSSLANYGINFASSEASYWLSEGVMQGMYGDRDLGQSAMDRYTNSSFWVNQGTGLASSMVSSIATSKMDKDALAARAFTNNGISAGFNFLGSMINGAISGQMDAGYALNSAYQTGMFGGSDFMSRVNMDMLTSGVNSLASDAGKNWLYNTDAGKKAQFRQGQWRAIANSDAETKKKIMADLWAKLSITDLEEGYAESTRNEWGRKEIALDRDLFSDKDNTNLLAVIGAHEAWRDGYNVGDTLPNGEVITQNMQDKEIITAVLAQTALANALINNYGASAINEFKGTFVENNLKMFESEGIYGLMAFALSGYDNASDFLKPEEKKKMTGFFDESKKANQDLTNAMEKRKELVEKFEKTKDPKILEELKKIETQITGYEKAYADSKKSLVSFMKINKDDSDVKKIVFDKFLKKYGELGYGEFAESREDYNRPKFSDPNRQYTLIDCVISLINQANNEPVQIWKYKRGLDTNGLGRFLLFGNSDSVDLESYQDFSFDPYGFGNMEDVPNRQGNAWEQNIDVNTSVYESTTNPKKMFKENPKLVDKKTIQNQPKNIANWMSSGADALEGLNWLLSTIGKSKNTSDIFLYTTKDNGQKKFSVFAPYIDYSKLGSEGKLNIKYDFLDEYTFLTQYPELIIDLAFDNRKADIWK